MSAAVNLHFMEKNNCLQEKAIGGTTITQKEDKKEEEGSTGFSSTPNTYETYVAC